MTAHLAPRRGFSLLEMMLVLLIMGTLVSIVVVNLVGASDRANTRITKINMGQIENALKNFKFEKGSFPTSEEGLIILTPDYLDRVPDDGWKHAFLYYSPSTNPAVDYDIISLGADGLPDTEDDIFNWTLKR